MNDIYYGSCRFCGQIQAMDQLAPDVTQDEVDEAVTRKCDCSEAIHYRAVQSRIETARKKVNELFVEKAGLYGFATLEDEHILSLIDQIVILVSNGWIRSGQVQLTGNEKAKVSMTSKGEIKVERAESSAVAM